MQARVTYLADTRSRYKIVAQGQSALFEGGQTLTVSEAIGMAALRQNAASLAQVFYVEFVEPPAPPVPAPVKKEPAVELTEKKDSVENVEEPERVNKKFQNSLFRRDRKRDPND